MKVKVIKKFRDKTSKKKEIRKVGDIITVNKGRFDELVKAGNYVEPADEDKAQESIEPSEAVE